MDHNKARYPHVIADHEGNDIVIFDEGHTYNDMLRFIVDEVGIEEARELFEQTMTDAREAAQREPDESLGQTTMFFHLGETAERGRD